MASRPRLLILVLITRLHKSAKVAGSAEVGVGEGVMVWYLVYDLKKGLLE